MATMTATAVNAFGRVAAINEVVKPEAVAGQIVVTA